MEAKELMIRDWVNVSARFLETTEERNATSGSYKLRQENCRVSGLNGDLIAIDKIYSDVFSYEPIPLTEETLKANGFCNPKYDDGADVEHILAYDKDGFLCLNKHRDYYYISSKNAYIHIKYVHELQHALRLCGLTKLADSFKID